MAEPKELPVVDDPPKSGVYRHLEDRPLTTYEMARGNDLGQRINVEDDEDSGL